VRFVGTRIGGGLDASGASLNGGGGQALCCDGAEIAGRVLLQQVAKDRLVCTGEIRFPAARIGNLFIQGADLVPSEEGICVYAPHALIAQGLVLMDVRRAPEEECDPDNTHPTGRFDLSGAHVGRLWDNPETGWPERGKLDLDGFTYDTIEFPPDRTDRAKARLDWIDLQYSDPPEREEFKPQPYEQLAKTFRAMGHAQEADKVAVAKRDRRRKCKVDPWWRRWFHWFMWAVSLYGYSPVRAQGAVCIWWALGAVILTLVLHAGWIEFKPVNPPSSATSIDYVASWPGDWYWPPLVPRVPEATVAHDDAGCPGLATPIYALDLIVPVLDLGQESACRIETKDLDGGFLQLGRAFYEIMGAILTAIAITTLTGVLKKD